MKNPVKAATEKALAWFRKGSLVTPPVKMNYTPPEAVVHIGQMVAIEYLSNKFDGKERIYRHEFTKLRDLYVSVNGDTFIVHPGCKITTRGIEG